ncbi:protein of unknown function [Candidatus Nitrosocosmicus franklandus]|uniref:Uncharacterized protein n=1 Tax=Candidatus Nitrosocosmicus franklandianus TaxID=1798806 RepID=A0A484IB26_9ARCH|nr:protein of unknown function [Candidatus Nitrosocosmicus franklandus]
MQPVTLKEDEVVIDILLSVLTMYTVQSRFQHTLNVKSTIISINLRVFNLLQFS